MTNRKWTDASVLRPTQITVGMVESRKKRDKMAVMTASDRKEWLAEHPVPAVISPSRKQRIFDHHHLARAVVDGDFGEVLVETVEDFSSMTKEEFWREMAARHWAHPYGTNGETLGFDAIPKSVNDLLDDPYRSLAGLAREAGAYAKTPTPFAEFVWADFFRKHLPNVQSGKHFEAFLAEAILLARCSLATGMPGYIAREIEALVAANAAMAHPGAQGTASTTPATAAGRAPAGHKFHTDGYPE